MIFSESLNSSNWKKLFKLPSNIYFDFSHFVAENQIILYGIILSLDDSNILYKIGFCDCYIIIW